MYCKCIEEPFNAINYNTVKLLRKTMMRINYNLSVKLLVQFKLKFEAFFQNLHEAQGWSRRLKRSNENVFGHC